MALATSSPNARPPFASQGGMWKPTNQSSNGNSIGFASLSLAPSSSLGFGFASSAPMPTTFGTSSPAAAAAGPSSSPSPFVSPLNKQQQRAPTTSARRRRREDSSDEDQDSEDTIPSHRPLKKIRSPSAAFFSNNTTPTQAHGASPLSHPLGHRSSDEVMRQLGKTPELL